MLNSHAVYFSCPMVRPINPNRRLSDAMLHNVGLALGNQLQLEVSSIRFEREQLPNNCPNYLFLKTTHWEREKLLLQITIIKLEYVQLRILMIKLKRNVGGFCTKFLRNYDACFLIERFCQFP